MKNLIIIVVAIITYCNQANAQWVQRLIDKPINGKPIFSVYSDILFTKQGAIYVYDRQINGQNAYYVSFDNGDSWYKKSTTNLIANVNMYNYCFGHNKLEEENDGTLSLELKYHGCYDFTKLNYVKYSNKKLGEWVLQPEYSSFLNVEDHLWQKLTLENDKMVVIVNSSFEFQKSPVAIYSNSGLGWERKNIIINNASIVTHRVAGSKFINSIQGAIFLPDKYIVTNDGGSSWAQQNIPVKGETYSGDIVDVNNVIVSKGDAVYLYNLISDKLAKVYSINDDKVVIVRYYNSKIHMLTQEGYYIISSINHLSKKYDFIKDITEVSELNKKQFSVYPNPATSSITVISKASLSGKLVRVCDLVGKTMYLKNDISEHAILLDVEAYSPGVYYIIIEDSSGQKLEQLKWIKQ